VVQDTVSCKDNLFSFTVGRAPARSLCCFSSLPILSGFMTVIVFVCSVLYAAFSSLQLQHNSLEGPLPSTMGALTALAHLDVSFNFLTGTVPSQLTHLGVASFAMNCFTNVGGQRASCSAGGTTTSGSATVTTTVTATRTPSRGTRSNTASPSPTQTARATQPAGSTAHPGAITGTALHCINVTTCSASN
jgi:hypothetical protein